MRDVRTEQHDIASSDEKVGIGASVQSSSIQRVREQPVARTSGPAHPVAETLAEVARDEYSRQQRKHFLQAHSKIVRDFSHRAYSQGRTHLLAPRMESAERFGGLNLGDHTATDAGADLELPGGR